LCREYGGADQEEARDDATVHIKKCEELGPPFVTTNTFTKKQNYLYLEKLMTATSKEEWKAVVQEETQENIWESLATETCMNLLGFA
jgi:hypothetical protein